MTPGTAPGPGDRLVLLTLALLVVTELIREWLPEWVALVLMPLLALGLVLAADRLGVDRDRLGLGRGWLRTGTRMSLAVLGVLAGGVAVLALLPATRSLFQDQTYRGSMAHALLVALVYVPLGTVLIEEVAFRGALLGGLEPRLGTRGALWVSAAAFGAWHALSSLRLAGANAGIGSVVGSGSGGTALAVAGTVLFTGLAGALLGWLRLRSHSLLPAIVAHWTANGAAVVAAAAVWASR